MFARKGESGHDGAVTGITVFAGRIGWYLRALGFNPLVRAVDRIEALAILGVVVTALVALPAALSAATLVRDSGTRTAQEQALSRHSVEAVVVEGAGLPTNLDTPAYVHVQWREGPRTRTESLVGAATIKADDRMTVWLDNATDKVVPAPVTTSDAEFNGFAAGVTLWVSLVMAGALAAYVIRRFLDRSRARAWDRELLLFAHNDDGWANRF